MAMFVMRKSSGRVARGAALALALVATSLLLLQPICVAAEVPATSPHRAALSEQVKDAGGIRDGSADESCCPVLDAASVLSSISPPSSDVQAASPPPQPVFVEPAHGKPYAYKARLAVVSLSPIPRYHARSARILR